MVTKGVEGVHTGAIAADVRRAHVCRVSANDVEQRLLVAHNLVAARRLVERAEVEVGPGVRRNLVALVVDALDKLLPLRDLVDSALVQVVARDEEGGLDVLSLEQIQDRGRVDVRAVIKRSVRASVGRA